MKRKADDVQSTDDVVYTELRRQFFGIITNF